MLVLNQIDILSVILYGINLVPLAKELRAVDLVLLSPFHADDAAFVGSTRQSAQLLKLLMERGADRDISLSRISPSSWRKHQGRRRQRR